MHLIPSAFFALNRRERAFIIAAIEIRVEKEKEKQKRRERKKKKRKLRIPQKEQTQELQNILKDIDEKIARVDVYLLSKECEDKEEENHL